MNKQTGLSGVNIRRINKLVREELRRAGGVLSRHHLEATVFYGLINDMPAQPHHLRMDIVNALFSLRDKRELGLSNDYVVAGYAPPAWLEWANRWYKKQPIPNLPRPVDTNEVESPDVGQTRLRLVP